MNFKICQLRFYAEQSRLCNYPNFYSIALKCIDGSKYLFVSVVLFEKTAEPNLIKFRMELYSFALMKRSNKNYKH